MFHPDHFAYRCFLFSLQKLTCSGLLLTDASTAWRGLQVAVSVPVACDSTGFVSRGLRSTYCHLVANSGCISLGRACRRTHTIAASPAYPLTVNLADDLSDDNLVWSQLSASDVLDLGWVAAGVAQPLTFAIYVPRHPLNLLLRTTWTPELCPELCPKLCRTLPPWSKCLLHAWPLSCRLCDFLNIAVANDDSKVMSFAFLRTSSLLDQFCHVSPLMFLYYVANSPPTLTPCVNFVSAVKGCTMHFSGSWSTTATIGTLAFRSRTSDNYPTTAHYSCG